MKVLVQKNIWNEYGYDRFLASLRNQGAEVKEVNLIPFTTEIVDLDGFEPDYVFGSTRFVTVCREKGMPVFPKVPFNCDDDDSPMGCFGYDDWLNPKGYVLTMDSMIGRAESFEYPIFVKPRDTEKFFTGLVLESPGDIDKIQLSTSFVEDPYQERVYISSLKNIIEEIRFFVIQKKIITASQYKVKGIRAYKEITSPHPAWIKATELMKGCPPGLTKGFVMDLGLYEGEWKVIELNDLGSAGIYMCDTDLLSRSLMNNLK